VKNEADDAKKGPNTARYRYEEGKKPNCQLTVVNVNFVITRQRCQMSHDVLRSDISSRYFLRYHNIRVLFRTQITCKPDFAFFFTYNFV
jgi:hypothetical protein